MLGFSRANKFTAKRAVEPLCPGAQVAAKDTSDASGMTENRTEREALL
jgi:hypothetical protein|eukprot:COSAG02_NODE_423_length_22576_cov_62.034791_2_plen_48_part_00